jgi:hypothetical protein
MYGIFEGGHQTERQLLYTGYAIFDYGILFPPAAPNTAQRKMNHLTS